MTVEKFIDERVRPTIGDTLKKTEHSEPPSKQLVKYRADVLLDYLNEGILDIATHSTFFKKTAYALLHVGTDRVILPPDFKGFYKSSQIQAGVAYDTRDGNIWDLALIPDYKGMHLNRKVTDRDISQYGEKATGFIPLELLNELISSGQITPPANPGVQVSMEVLHGKILVKYDYLALPPEYELSTEIADRELMYMLRWWVAAHALYGDMHNEASNLGQLYEKKYLQRREKAGILVHNMNAISLTPYTAQGGYNG